MKRYLTYIILAALALLAFGCKKDDDADRKDLDSRQRVPVSVTYSVDGAQVTALSFTHGATRKTVDVNVNNENLHWDIVSNSPWCRVIPASHVGPGSITLEIDANEDFEAREPATLTFIAGEFRGASLTVNQGATAFLISHPYLLSSKEEGAFEVTVKTVEGTVWTVESGPEWIETETTDAGTEDGMSVTTVRLKPMANDGNSRYGTVTLSTGDDDDSIALYQFGEEDLQYDGEGHIFFPNDEPASLSLIAPAFAIREVLAPEYATCTSDENTGGTVTWTVAFEENLSDCAEARIIPVSLLLNNAASTAIEFPSILQDYLPAGGLMTAKGLKLFAAAVSEGGDTSDWETDGVFSVLQDIDMDGVTDWAGIGTEEHPFSGVFDGKGHSILNMQDATAGLFNQCNGATVSSIAIDKHSNFSFASGEMVGALAAQAKASTFNNCSFAGVIEYSGVEEESSVGGLVGYADATSSFTACKMAGQLLLTSGSATSGLCRAGGIAGLCDGSLTGCEFTGKINCLSKIPTVEIGGITSLLVEGVSVSGHSCSGSINIEGETLNVYVGGLYGHISGEGRTFDKATDKSLMSGSIRIANFKADANARVFAGGLVGLLDAGLPFTARGYEILTSFTLDNTTSHTGGYLCCGGILGGCAPEAVSGDLVFDNLTNQGAYDIMYAVGSSFSVRPVAIGGVVGLVRGKADFTSCVNKGYIGGGTAQSILGANPGMGAAKHYAVYVGGIAGFAFGGDVTFTDCSNEGNLDNNQYNNAASIDSRGFGGFTFRSNTATGGILGAFDTRTSPDGKTVTFDNCTNTCKMQAFRGYVGGIVGFACNAEIKNCSWLSGCSDTYYNAYNQGSFKGGIAGGLVASEVSDCIVNSVQITSHKGGSAEAADAGGIVGRILSGDPVTISKCSYYGDLNCTSNSAVKSCGGIVSTVESNTVIKNCRFGGKVMGSPIATKTMAEEKAVGTGTCTVENIDLWDGK